MFAGRASRLSARRPRLAPVPLEVWLRRLPGRRHGPGQNHPGSGLAGATPRPTAAKQGGHERHACRARLPWSSCRAPWSSTGTRRPVALRPPCEYSITAHARDQARRKASRISTPSSPPTASCERDILDLKEHRFDYCILDEAQAIKNSTTQSAKAVRLLQANHRLALSGTPIENHLGELWSLFEFLNPGMLGTASVFQLLSGASTTRTQRLASYWPCAPALHSPPHQGPGSQRLARKE